MAFHRFWGLTSFLLVSTVSTVVYLRKPDSKAYSPAYDPEIQETPIRRIRSKAFEEFEAYAFDPKARYKTTALLVASGDQILYESYAGGLRANRPQRLYSLSKIATSMLAGHLIQRGFLSLEDRVADYVPSPSRPWRRKLLVRDLLNMSSGLEYFRVDEAQVPGLGVFARNHLKSFVSDYELTSQLAVPVAPPGTLFNYSLIDNNLLALVLNQALHRAGGYPYLQTLFAKLGLRRTKLDLARDKPGVTTLFTPRLKHLFSLANPEDTYRIKDHVRFWSTPRDVLALTSLFINHGKAKGEVYLPTSWPAFSWTIAPAQRDLRSDPGNYNGHSYGAFWWLNKPLMIRPDRPYPSLPESLAMIKGLGGQTLAVVPEERLILIRFGDDPPDGLIDRAKLMTLLRKAIREIP